MLLSNLFLVAARFLYFFSSILFYFYFLFCLLLLAHETYTTFIAHKWAHFDVVVVAVVVAPLFVYVCSLVSHFLPPTIIYAR